MDRETKNWIRTPADEKAAAAGMRFDGERGQFVCDWIESTCCLYEGDRAGQPLMLYPVQREYFMRLFSWVEWSDEWNQWKRRFTKAAFWCAKKNGKSPMAAAYNLYLCCADGEPGNKVYMMAADGKQARIAQEHAVNMVDQSPLLAADCKVNRSTLDILHRPTGSRIIVVTGNDRRGADSKHGYNGSVTIDEMHVVTRPMMDAVGRAGISRREPLQVSFSTAGTELSSVGYERCQYGRQVNSGEREDLHFLHVEYTAPDATDAMIDEHLDEYGKAANPAWGILIKPSEFRADWESSRGNPQQVAKFNFERLSRWVGSTVPWLDSRGWEAGKREYTLADLAGRDCYLGLDLARKLDMTAAAYVFPWPEDGEEAVRLWLQFWLPAETAKERDHLYPFRTWAERGDLFLTIGGTVDYTTVKADIRRTISANRLNVLGLYYDPAYANEMTQALHEGEPGAPGCVGERVEVRQSMMGLTGAACEFERRVKGAQVQHPDNAVLNWQVSHVQVKVDANQNKMPQKPAANSGKNIDGIAATLDAFVGLLSQPPVIYASPNILVL